MTESQKSKSELPEAALERLLKESEALRWRSEELDAEVKALRERVAGLNGQPQEPRKKPRLRGK